MPEGREAFEITVRKPRGSGRDRLCTTLLGRSLVPWQLTSTLVAVDSRTIFTTYITETMLAPPVLVEVFLVPVKPVCVSAIELLSPEERLRLSEMRSEGARNEFVSLRACLRLILAERLGGSPQSVAILVKPGCPPVVRDSGWYFSLSHSTTYGVVALSRGGPIGVDIEADHQVQDAMAIARAVLHPSECEWVSGHSVDTRSAAFLQLWVRKEAVVKASGQGLAVGLDSWSVLTVPDQAGSSVDVELQGRAWRVRDVAGPSGYYLALATQCLDVDVRLGNTPSGWSPGQV